MNTAINLQGTSDEQKQMILSKHRKIKSIQVKIEQQQQQLYAGAKPNDVLNLKLISIKKWLEKK